MIPSLSPSGLIAHLGASLRPCILFSVSYWDPFQLIWQFAVQQSSPWGSGWILDGLVKFHFNWLLWYKWFMILQWWWGLFELTFPHGLVCSRINTELYHHGELPVTRQLHLYPQQLSWRPGSRAQSGGGKLVTCTEDNQWMSWAVFQSALQPTSSWSMDRSQIGWLIGLITYELL